jgi:hypothetical protein
MFEKALVTLPIIFELGAAGVADFSELKFITST